MRLPPSSSPKLILGQPSNWQKNLQSRHQILLNFERCFNRFLIYNVVKLLTYWEWNFIILGFISLEGWHARKLGSRIRDLRRTVEKPENGDSSVTLVNWEPGPSWNPSRTLENPEKWHQDSSRTLVGP